MRKQANGRKLGLRFSLLCILSSEKIPRTCLELWNPLLRIQKGLGLCGAHAVGRAGNLVRHTAHPKVSPKETTIDVIPLQLRTVQYDNHL